MDTSATSRPPEKGPRHTWLSGSARSGGEWIIEMGRCVISRVSNHELPRARSGWTRGGETTHILKSETDAHGRPLHRPEASYDAPGPLKPGPKPPAPTLEMANHRHLIYKVWLTPANSARLLNHVLKESSDVGKFSDYIHWVEEAYVWNRFVKV